MDMLDKGKIHVQGGMDQNVMRLYHITQNGVHLKTYNLFIFGVFHLIFLDCYCPWITEAMESETRNKEGLLYKTFNLLFQSPTSAGIASKYQNP